MIFWDDIVTKYHEMYLKRLQRPINVETYIQSVVLKKTVETISFYRQRGLESGPNADENWERASLSVITGAEMHKQPIPPLEHEKTEENGVKQINKKKFLPFILDDVTTIEEPTINSNEESDLEEYLVVNKVEGKI